jgi:ankyrin repeat protein
VAGLDEGCWAGSSAMDDVWEPAATGDVGEVEQLVGQDPGLLNAKEHGFTPLMLASADGRVEVVRWLLDHGATIDERDIGGNTALLMACDEGQTSVVRLLLGRGAEPTLADQNGWTPLMAASVRGHLEVVRSLLGHPGYKAIVNQRNKHGETVLWWACVYGRQGVVRALLESGADPTIATNSGNTPTAVAKNVDVYPEGATAQGRRECVAELEVSFSLPFFFPLSAPFLLI